MRSEKTDLEDLGEEQVKEGVEWLTFVIDALEESPELAEDHTWNTELFADPDNSDYGKVTIEELIGGLLQAKELLRRMEEMNVAPYKESVEEPSPLPWTIDEEDMNEGQEKFRQDCYEFLPNDVRDEMEYVYENWESIIGGEEERMYEQSMIQNPTHQFIHMISMAMGAKLRGDVIAGRKKPAKVPGKEDSYEA